MMLTEKMVILAEMMRVAYKEMMFDMSPEQRERVFGTGDIYEAMHIKGAEFLQMFDRYAEGQTGEGVQIVFQDSRRE